MKLKALVLVLIFSITISTMAQETGEKSFEVYGFAMADLGYNSDQINPAWFDAMRITRLPKYKDQFAPSGQVFFGVRQTRFGVKGWTPTAIGELKTRFEFDMFGVGPDEGQTTIRLRFAYGEFGKWLIGQAESPFMDSDVWPNTVEYWGPTGMVFYRNVQLRYMPMMGDNEVYIAIERPGASADKGSFSDRVELSGVVGRMMLPDFSAHYKRRGSWGSIQIAGMYRDLRWEDVDTTGGGPDLSGSTTGWGAHLSTVINIGSNDVFRGSVVYGEGIQNYMQDSPVDVGVDVSGNSIKGVALPITGIMAWLDHKWSDKYATSLGYSSVDIDNTDYASTDAYKKGEYASVNIVYTPAENMMMAAEFQWGKRHNDQDGFSSECKKIQLSFKYNFSQAFYRSK